MKTRNLYNLIVLLISLLLSQNLIAQVGINATGAAPDPKAMLDINSTSKGFLWPRMSLAQRSAISSSPGVTPEGLTIFDTDTKNLWMWKNSTWVPYLQSTWETSGVNTSLIGSGNVGIGTINPILSGLVINKKVGNSHAIFGDNTSGVSIESNFPGIHFNSYFNTSRKTLSTGYTSGVEMDPITGTLSIYTSPTSTPAGNTAAVFSRLNIDKDGKVLIGNGSRLMVYDASSTNDLYFSGGDAKISTGASNSNLILQQWVDTKVAIGNITPTQKLDINGQIRIRGGSPALNKVLTSAADGTASWENAAATHIHYGQSWTGSALKGLEITNFASADFNVAITGNANSALRSKGIVGGSTSTTGIGVYGINSSGGGTLFSPADNSGVSGVAGNGIGVFGAGYSGRGIWGLSNSAEGVYGNSVLGNSIYGAKTTGQTTGSAGVFEVLNVANTSSALVARSENTALEIDGAIKVINTSVNKPVFTHVTSGANTSLHLTSITYNNPLVTDLLIVTPNYTAGSVYNAHPIGVWFNGGVWKIFNQDLAAMPIGTAFNVMVIRQ